MQCVSLSQLFVTLLEESKKRFDLDAITLNLLFVVLLVETTTTKAMEIAERIRQRIQDNRTTFEDKTMQVTVSIGVADFQGRIDTTMPSDGQEKMLITVADHTLYQAKKAGRNCVVSATSA